MGKAEKVVRAEKKARRRSRSRAEIIDIAAEILLEEGVAGLTLEAVASVLEMTKPALYYYFRNKQALLQELVVTLLEAQVETVEAAVAEAETAAAAMEAFLRSFHAHYAARMPTFRLIHLQMQILGAKRFGVNAEQIARLQPLNDRLYGHTLSLIEAEQEAGLIEAQISARRAVFGAHLGVVGLLTYAGLSESAGDTLRYTDEALLSDLVEVHTRPLRHST